MALSTVSSRTESLLSVLKSKGGSTRLIAKIIDLENELTDLKSSLGLDKEEYPSIIDHSIQIEEIADDEGNINNQIPEFVWISSLNGMLNVMVVAIVSELPTQLGLYTWKILYRNEGDWAIRKGSVKVWVVFPES